MAKYLHMLKSGLDITRGRSYEIVLETDTTFYIRDDVHDEHAFSKQDENRLFTLDTEVSLEYKRTQLATLTSEIAQLEAQLAEESRLKVGDYARVTDTTSVDNFTLDDIVRITRYEDATYPLRGVSPISDVVEWFAPASLTKITPDEARASLIAKIDAHFDGQEAD
ncbi:hypothetical protein [Paenibacillus sp. TC-CSREp1]|uniref:hypothetical protein n=1 Tax=Paenibacillus sp. TC-CSREp1 TaxID=3410089 RepID=UPI003CFB42D7